MSLRAKQEAFINYMLKPDLARHGFEMLLRQPNFESWFEPLLTAGVFDPTCNPGPEPAEQEGYVRLPFWPALTYLKAVAEVARRDHDVSLGAKIMEIVRTVTNWTDANGKRRQNFHTSRMFAQILGIIPTETIQLEDLALIEKWLDDSFENGLVTAVLEEEVMPNLLASPLHKDHEKALELVKHCIRPTRNDFRFTGEDFWLKRLVNANAQLLGRLLGLKAARLFAKLVLAVFEAEERCSVSSRIYRPAIESSSQNHEYNTVVNIPVDGLREVLLGWSEKQDNEFRDYVKELLNSKAEILRRVGIYLLNRHWSFLRQLYPSVLTQSLFELGHLHELFGLLQAHFGEFEKAERQQTLDIIGAISDEEAQLRWLLALKAFAETNQQLKTWISTLEKDLGYSIEHPDYLSFTSSSYGPGPSPFTAEDFRAFVADGTLDSKIASFEPGPFFRGPSLDGLIYSLQDSAKKYPDAYLERRNDLLKLEVQFRSAILYGIRRAWEDPLAKEDHLWSERWKSLLSFLELLVRNVLADDKADQLQWLYSEVAEVIQSGTKADDHAFPPELLLLAWPIIDVLLEVVICEVEIPKDPMFHALNSPRGRTIDALVNLSLRNCRVSDKEEGNHRKAWAAIELRFDREFQKCMNSNLEFSTLVAAYLSNFQYLSEEWVRNNIHNIFPKNEDRNFKCAIDGLAYAPFTKSIYHRLLEGEVIDKALAIEGLTETAHEKLMERVAAAFLWGEETLDSPRFDYIFAHGSAADHQNIGQTFWNVRDGQLTGDQRQRIRQYFGRAIKLSTSQLEPPKQLLSSQSVLIFFVDSLASEYASLLAQVAPFVKNGYYEDIFVQRLALLTPTGPDAAAQIAARLLDGHVPEYDYDDHWKNLLRVLFENGQRIEAIKLADKLRSLNGMYQLFVELKAKLHPPLSS